MDADTVEGRRMRNRVVIERICREQDPPSLSGLNAMILIDDATGKGFVVGVDEFSQLLTLFLFKLFRFGLFL